MKEFQIYFFYVRTTYALYNYSLLQAYPVAFALMSRRTEAAYCAVFQRLMLEVPEWNPRLVVTDFEQAERNALTRCFPGALLKGCWFHYCQVITVN